MTPSRISGVYFLVAILETISFSNSLTGDHVCSRIEKLVSRDERKGRSVNVTSEIIIIQ